MRPAEIRALPSDVATSLVRGLGAFLRATPVQELPGSLRRFRGYRPQTLVRHRDELLSALDDAAMRARVLEWVEGDRARLPTDQAAALREASAREDGWEERLRALTRGDARPRGPHDDDGDSARIESLEAKVRRARDEARDARAAGRRELSTERARRAALEREVRALESELASVRRSLDDARAGAEREAAELGRRLRRAERSLERARSDNAELRARLKDERKNESGVPAPRAHRGARSVPARADEPATRSAPRPPRRRRPLPAPKGRFEDDPETLEDWLDEYAAHLLVDGYNVTKAPGGYGSLELQTQRERLVEEVERLARRKQARATIVFDGSQLPPGTRRRRRGHAEVEYSRPPESGDDHLVAVLSDLPPDPVVVVTDDRELRDRVRPLGATVASSRQLLGLIRW